MRRVLSLLVLLVPVLSVQARADDPPPPDAAPVHHVRQTWEHHFAGANLAHDGHLTLDEAKSGYALIAKHFDDIDVDHKGYVTLNDVRAWHVMRKAAHRLARPPEDKLRPRSAVQRTFPDMGGIGGSPMRTATAASDLPAANH